MNRLLFIWCIVLLIVLICGQVWAGLLVLEPMSETTNDVAWTVQRCKNVCSYAVDRRNSLFEKHPDQTKYICSLGCRWAEHWKNVKEEAKEYKGENSK